MKTSVIEVHDMLSVLSVDEIEKRTGAVPGVESVTVNFAAGNATVRYDETRLNIADLNSTVRQRGFESTAPEAASAGQAGKDHEGHTASGTPPATPATDAPKTAPGTASAGTAPQEKAAPAAPIESKPPPSAAPAGDEQPDKAAPGKN